LTCSACYRANCIEENASKCKCGKTTRNKICKARHDETVCFKNKICNICNTLRKGSKHACKNQIYCYNCRDIVDNENGTHRCYILSHAQVQEKDKNKRKRQFRGIMYFDFESFVDPKTSYHVVNLAIAQRVCVKCIDNYSERCEKCCQKIIYYNISDFVDFVLDKENEFYIFISHNGIFLNLCKLNKKNIKYIFILKVKHGITILL
jgi:hypothetical protein